MISSSFSSAPGSHFFFDFKGGVFFPSYKFVFSLPLFVFVLFFFFFPGHLFSVPPFDESLAITPQRAIRFAFVWLDIRKSTLAPFSSSPSMWFMFATLRSAPHLSWLDLDNRKRSIFLGPFSNLRTLPLYYYFSSPKRKKRTTSKKMFLVGVCVKTKNPSQLQYSQTIYV